MSASARNSIAHASAAQPLAAAPAPRPDGDEIDEHATDREHARDHEDRHHRRSDLAVAEQPVVVRVDEEADAAGKVVAVVGGLHPPALHLLGPIEPVEMQDRRRDVDHVHEAVVSGRRRTQQTRAKTGCAHGDRSQRRSFLRGRRTDDDDRVAGRVHVGEQPADERIGVAEGTCTETHALLVGRESTREVGAHQVRSLDEHDRPVLPSGTERIEHRIGIEALAEGCRRVGFEEPGSTRPRGTFPSWVINAATALRR